MGKLNNKFNILLICIMFSVITVLTGCITNSNSSTANRCLEVSQFIISNIESGLDVYGGGSLRNAKAVKSNDFESVYFISTDIQGSGLEGDDDIATFATNKLNETGVIYAISGYAEQFSVWPYGPDISANITMYDDGARESQRCVNN